MTLRRVLLGVAVVLAALVVVFWSTIQQAAFAFRSGFRAGTDYERLEADPRIDELRREISECVADKDHEFTDMESIYGHFEDELQEIDASIDYSMFELSEEEMSAMSDAELEEFFRSPPALSDDAKAKLGELQAEELALAKAVSECGGGFEAEFELTAEIRAEYEREFLETYADELEPYRAG